MCEMFDRQFHATNLTYILILPEVRSSEGLKEVCPTQQFDLEVVVRWLLGKLLPKVLQHLVSGRPVLLLRLPGVNTREKQHS